ncbi:MAG: zinc-ribbon domain-containing protein, partial [Chloroflexota bacterium]
MPSCTSTPASGMGSGRCWTTPSSGSPISCAASPDFQPNVHFRVMIVCPSCGKENPDRYRRCGFCGTLLASSRVEE